MPHPVSTAALSTLRRLHGTNKSYAYEFGQKPYFQANIQGIALRDTQAQSGLQGASSAQRSPPAAPLAKSAPAAPHPRRSGSTASSQPQGWTRRDGTAPECDGAPPPVRGSAPRSRWAKCVANAKQIARTERQGAVARRHSSRAPSQQQQQPAHLTHTRTKSVGTDGVRAPQAGIDGAPAACAVGAPSPRERRPLSRQGACERPSACLARSTPRRVHPCFQEAGTFLRCGRRGGAGGTRTHGRRIMSPLL